MSVEVVVPAVGESILEVQIAQWLKSEGQWVAKDENIVEVESDKATVQVPSPVAGRLAKILKQQGDFAEVGAAIAQMDDSPQSNGESAESSNGKAQVAEPPPVDAKTTQSAATPAKAVTETKTAEPASPILPTAAPASPKPAPPERHDFEVDPELEQLVPMSMLRRRIAERLVEAQHTAALLTTFNEIDMTEVMELRARFKDEFQKSYGVKLGFMSFFVKAAVEALKRYPQVNAEIRGTDVLYRNHFDIGVAVGGGKGVVVPVLRRAELLSFAEIERRIADFGAAAQKNEIMLDDLRGGTFTISNGGVYGSLLSTPIVNPPQSGILGLHAIQDRPVAIAKQVVIRPMMYVALTYDHRLVDGREAVGFLRTIKETVETPSRLLLEI